MQLVYGLPSTKLGGVALEENDDSSDDKVFIPKGQKKVHIRCIHYKLYYIFLYDNLSYKFNLCHFQ